MNKKQNFPKLQHLVPQFVLRNFCIGKDNKLFAFDKHEEKIFNTGTRNIAAENGFYNFDFKDLKLSIEIPLSNIEGETSAIIKKIISSQNLSVISKKEKRILSFFLSIQKLRGYSTRETLLQMNQLLEDHLKKMGADLSKVKGFKKLEEEEIKKISIGMIIDADHYTPYFYNKSWILYRTLKKRPFYISDTPLVLQNNNDYGFHGNIGLAVKGIEIYFPISDTLILGLLCKSNEEMIRDVHKKYHMLKDIVPDLRKKLKTTTDYHDRFVKAFDTGEPFDIREDSLINLNSLQVIYSSRFVYSSINDFSLLQEMIADDPLLKKPPRMTVG